MQQKLVSWAFLMSAVRKGMQSLQKTTKTTLTHHNQTQNAKLCSKISQKWARKDPKNTKTYGQNKAKTQKKKQKGTETNTLSPQETSSHAPPSARGHRQGERGDVTTFWTYLGQRASARSLFGFGFHREISCFNRRFCFFFRVLRWFNMF